jgi:hypothetical protein
MPTRAVQQERTLLLPKGAPSAIQNLAGRSSAIAQEYGRTKWNLRGFSRTGRPVTKSHEPAPFRLQNFREFREIRGIAAH